MLSDPESGRQREVHASALLRREFAAAAAEHRAGVAAAIRGAGGGHLVLRTDSDWIADTVRFVVARKRRWSGEEWPDVRPQLPRLHRALVVPAADRGGAIVVGYVVVQRMRRKRTMRFTNLELLEKVAPKRQSWVRHLPPVVLVISLMLLTTAMAGPTDEQRVPRNRATVMLVIDVSLSMEATDVAADPAEGRAGRREGLRRPASPPASTSG